MNILREKMMSGKNKKKIMELFILILITCLLRLPSFFLRHNNNDELIYLSLALKMDAYGLQVFKNRQYNLFYIDKAIDAKNHLIGLFEGPTKEGTFLEGLLWESETLSHHPPALPFLIAISHKFLSKGFIYVANVSSNIYLMGKNAMLQFYACYIPFLFSLFLIVLVYILGAQFFSHRIGLAAASFLSLTPVELLTSNKIWADDMTAFFVVLSVFFYLYALKNNRFVFSLWSGVSCGIAIITKMSGIYIIFVIVLFHLFENRKMKINLKNVTKFLLDRNVLYFLAGVFIVSAWWFSLFYTNFPIKNIATSFRVNETNVMVKNWNQYFSVASGRPWFSYFILTPFQFPLYVLSYILLPLFIFRKYMRSINHLIGEEERWIKFLILWFLVVITFLSLKAGKELRYMLIAYPAIAILSAYCGNIFYTLLKIKKVNVGVGLRRLLVISLIVVCVFHSLKIALPRILFRADIIPVPF